ncbi:MAG: hypothetical protein ACTH5W_20105 [Providencia sp.]|uniref:hypothetical protein n=1 Tax=Providencia sp. TaxID=589 RepID=UPI003F992B7B
MQTLPSWFFEAFNHLNETDVNKLIYLWKTEHVLQKAIFLLDKQNPSLNPPKKCPQDGSNH